MTDSVGATITPAHVLIGGVTAAVGTAALLGGELLLASRRVSARSVLPTYAQHAVAGASLAGTPVRVAVLGDSTVAGVGSATLDGWLGSQLAQRVSSELGRPVHVTGFGVSGARVSDVIAEQAPRLATATAAARSPWDAVVVVVGGNDVTHLTSSSKLVARTRESAQVVTDAAGGAPLVQAGTPRFLEATGLAQPLRAVLDHRSRTVVDKQHLGLAQSGTGARFVDLGVEASELRRGVPQMSRDGFHPDGRGYAFWADAIAPRVSDAVRSRQVVVSS